MSTANLTQLNVHRDMKWTRRNGTVNVSFYESVKLKGLSQTTRLGDLHE